MKYTAAFLLTILFFACVNKSEQKPKWPTSKIEIKEGRYNVAFLIMDGVYNTELTAPFDIFQHTIFRDSIKAMNTFMIAKTKEIVTSFEGIRMLPDFSYREKYPKIDILVVPSAEHHLDTDLEDKELINFIEKTGFPNLM